MCRGFILAAAAQVGVRPLALCYVSPPSSLSSGFLSSLSLPINKEITGVILSAPWIWSYQLRRESIRWFSLVSLKAENTDPLRAQEVKVRGSPKYLGRITMGPLFTADILTCQRGEGPGVINNVNDCSILFVRPWTSQQVSTHNTRAKESSSKYGLQPLCST